MTDDRPKACGIGAAVDPKLQPSSLATSTPASLKSFSQGGYAVRANLTVTRFRSSQRSENDI